MKITNLYLGKYCQLKTKFNNIFCHADKQPYTYTISYLEQLCED